jgi:hypothetical protein
MYKNTSLHCSYCNSELIKLPKIDVNKLDGLTFKCNCCQHENRLINMHFVKITEKNIMSYEEAKAINTVKQVI